VDSSPPEIPSATEPPAAGPGPDASPAIRASDQERDAATVRLQEAFAEGRLDDTAAAGTSPAPAPGRLSVAFKSSVRRSGRWRVPDRYTAVVYKGGGWLDLRAAELISPVTTLAAVAYKSRITILVPPGVRVEAGGFGADLDTDPAAVVPADAPVLHVRGFTYKGTVEVRSTPAGD
jgi:hypothetical protein